MKHHLNYPISSRVNLCFYYAILEEMENNMKEYILNTIVLKTGDSIEIVEPSTLPMKDRVMYKLQHEEDRVVIVRGNGKMVIPMDNIMFSSSIPLDIIHEDFDDEV